MVISDVLQMYGCEVSDLVQVVRPTLVTKDPPGDEMDHRIDRIINAATLDQADDALRAIERDVAAGRDKIPTLQEMNRLNGVAASEAWQPFKSRIGTLRLAAMFPSMVPDRTHLQDVINPSAAEEDARLVFVCLNDHGGLGVYVWSMGNENAIDEAESYALSKGWEVNEDDLACFGTNKVEQGIVLLRSKMLNNQL